MVFKISGVKRPFATMTASDTELKAQDSNMTNTPSSESAIEHTLTVTDSSTKGDEATSENPSDTVQSASASIGNPNRESALMVVEQPKTDSRPAKHLEKEKTATSRVHGPLKISAKRKLYRHMKFFSKKAFRSINDFRLLRGGDKLEWSERLYEVSYVTNCDMMGRTIMPRVHPMVGTQAVTVVLRITLQGDGAETQTNRRIRKTVGKTILSELRKRAFHEARILSEFMKFGAVDVFGLEDDFIVCIILTRDAPFCFSQTAKRN